MGYEPSVKIRGEGKGGGKGNLVVPEHDQEQKPGPHCCDDEPTSLHANDCPPLPALRCAPRGEALTMAGLVSGKGNKRAAFAVRGDDLYETPAVAIEALLRVEALPPVIWEPACGPGAIVRVLRAAGHIVHSSDLVDYASPDQDHAGWDFLMERQLPLGVEAIVTNPPFKLAAEFVAHALMLCPKVMMLLRLAFFESERRTSILDDGKLASIHVFSARLPMMHRAGWEGRKANSGMAFAWFVWDRNHKGPAMIDRINWKPMSR